MRDAGSGRLEYAVAGGRAMARSDHFDTKPDVRECWLELQKFVLSQ